MLVWLALSIYLVHARIADFDGVEDFVVLVLGWKVLSGTSEERFADFGFSVFADSLGELN